MKKVFLSSMLALACAGSTQAQGLVDSFEVYFQLNKDLLLDQSKKTIDSMFQATDGRRLKLRVTGHTCKLGSETYNDGLSERRAKSAFTYVKSKGETDDKIELFFYGEANPKYEKLDPNRRVFVVLTLEDDDRDTLLKQNCLEVLVQKGSYKPQKNKNVQFEIRQFKSAADFKSNQLSMLDNTGRKLQFSTAMFYSAKFNGADLAAAKTWSVKMPMVKPANNNATLYRGSKGADGKVVWTNTGRPCGPTQKNGACETYNFDFQDAGYCACAYPRPCQEDCNEDPFGGEESPDKTAADVRSSTETVAKFTNGVYPKDLSALSVEVKEDKKFAYDLDLCGYFMNDKVTEEVFPAYRNINQTKNTIIEAKDGATMAKGDPNKTVTLYLLKSSVTVQKPIILTGLTTAQGFIRWDTEKREPTDCLGAVNCEYYVFQNVPASGNYKIGEWKEAAAMDKKNTHRLKTRVLKNCKVIVGEKVKDLPAPYVYKAKNHTRKNKTRPKEFDIKEHASAGDVVVLIRYEKGKKKLYYETRLSKLKFKKSKNMYIARKRDFKKIDDFKNIQLKECK